MLPQHTTTQCFLSTIHGLQHDHWGMKGDLRAEKNHREANTENTARIVQHLIFISGIKISSKSTMKTVSERPGHSMTLIFHEPNIFHRHSPKKGSWPCWCEIIYSALLTGFSSSVSPCTPHILPATVYSHFNTLEINLEKTTKIIGLNLLVFKKN